VILQQCLRNVDAIVCISQSTLSQLKRHTPSDVSRKGVRIYNCVDPVTECAARSPIPGSKGEPFLLCVAQHRRNKNIALLIRVFARLLQSGHVDPNMQLVVVGIGGPETRAIHQLIAELKLEARIHLLEGLSEPDLQWCYRRCEAFVAPSITEGFGAPVAEALLAGSRVVCSDIPAFREFASEHCRFVPLGEGEEEALADAVAESLRGPAGAPVSLPLLSPQVAAERYIAVYRSLLASSPFASLATIQPRIHEPGMHTAEVERQS
jgi:glycosyltransferase involved in cell wall biosynthesis